MSFGGGSTNNLPTKPQKALGIDETRGSTNEQARPLPYMAGKTRLGVTWITDVVDVRTEAVVSRTGKSQTSISGYNYYATLAGMICHGPVDTLEKIYFNGDLIWEGPLARDGEDVTEIDLEEYGKARIYWGTLTQEADAALVASGYIHPPYKRQCYIVLDQIYFGFNQTNAPNVELIVSRYPALDWFEAAVEIDGDCNPVAVIGELLMSSIFGLGWDVSRLDVDGLNAVAAILETEGLGISPLISKQMSARQMIAQICEYFDGYPILTTEGKFSLGLARKADDEGALPEISESVLVNEPQLDPESWSGVKTKTWIKYLDRTRDFQENTIPYRAPGIAFLSGDNTQQTIERLWTTTPAVAASQVAAAGRAAALPSTGGEIVVRKSAALTPGAMFRLTYAALGVTNLVMRVTSCDGGKPGSRSVSMNVALDRSYLNEPYYLPPDDAPPDPADTTPVPFTLEKIIELPRGLADGEKITLAPLAPRPNFFTTGFNVYLRKNYNVATVALPYWPQIAFDVGTLAAAYPVTPLIDDSHTLQISYSSLLDSQLATMAEQFRLVVQRRALPLALRGAQTMNEFMLVTDWQIISPGLAKAAVLRGRLNTVLQAAPSGQDVWFYEFPQPLISYSYDLIGEANRMPNFGTVAEDYSAITDLIDQRVGLLVDLAANSTTLVSPTLNNAFRNELLMFVGDEIISVSQVELVSMGRYRIWGIRARYDTNMMAHAIGEEVIIVSNENLKRLTNASFTRSSYQTFKLQPKVLSRTVDLSLVDPLNYQITDRVHAPLCPSNLRCLDDGHAPHLDYTDDAVLTWTLRESAPRDFWLRWNGNPAVVNAQTVLEFRTAADVLVRTETTAAAVKTYTYDDLDRVADFGSFITSFKVRAYAFENGLRSRFYSELTIFVESL